MRRVWGAIGPFRRTFFAAVALAVLAVGNDLLGPFIPQLAVDRYIAPRTPVTLSPAQRIDGVFRMSLLFFGVLLFGFVLRYLQNYLLSVLGQRVMYLLRSNMFEHLQQLSLAFFDHNPVGRLMTRITNDVDSLNDLFTSGAVNLIADLFTLAGIGVILFFAGLHRCVICFFLL